MTPLELAGLAAGAAFASGLNLYATVAVLGLLHRYEFVTLPASLEVLSSPVVLVVASALYLIEFVADKVPYVDNIWDVVHAFIRPPAAAVFAYSAFAGIPEEWRITAGLLAGGIALTSHGAKASTRAAVNASPEPLSNWVLSFAEDALAIGLSWMAITHPAVTLVVVLVLLALSIYLLTRLFRFLRWSIGRLRATPRAGDAGSTVSRS
jgi:hypothetical protein